MTLTGATPVRVLVQYSRRAFAENRKYQATGNGPRSVRRVSIIRRPITASARYPLRYGTRGSAKADAGKQKPFREPWTAAWTGIIAP